MKAVAELIENSIDGKSRSVTVTRGREGGRHYLSIKDDGEGVPRNQAGLPDFRYVATHICDSVKPRFEARWRSRPAGRVRIRTAFRQVYATQPLHAGLSFCYPPSAACCSRNSFAALDELAAIGEPVNPVLEVDLDRDEVTVAVYDLPSPEK